MPRSRNKRKRLLGFPKSYAFLVGINNYPKINAHLKSAVNDAKALAQVLKHQQGFDHVELLIEDTEDFQERIQPAVQARLDEGLKGVEVQLSVTSADFRNLLLRIQDPEQEPRINPQDCIVFYYAGHGKPGEFDEGPAGYLLPSDTRPDAARLRNDSLLPMEDVFETLKILDCHHTLLILDCCFAGKFRQASKSRDTGWISSLPLYEERFMRYKRERAWQVLVSAGPHQTAADWLGERQELDAHVHSPFAEALLEALEGKAELNVIGKRQGDGVLTSQELYLYLWDRVEKLTHSGQLGKNSQYPDLFPMSKHQGGQFIFFDPNNKLNFAKRIMRNPYRGLRSFEANESDLFFGRKAVIKTLLTHIVEQPLLVLTAPSGSGKSSLVKAGLFPALVAWKNEREEIPWAEAELFVLRPGERAWTGELQYPEHGKDGKKVIYTGLKALLPRLKQNKNQVLLLDQYEELFTSGVIEAERTTFENELISLYNNARSSGLKIILTLRSDYEWLLETSTFGQSFWSNTQLTHFLYRLPPMRVDELREAMINPALAELYEFETEKLVETILAEIGNAPGTLPMLSFTMSQFYEITDKDTRVFTAQGYQELGGINGALSKYADSIYNSLPVAQQGIMRQLFIRMVKVSDGRYGRRRVYGCPVSNFTEDRKRNFLNEFDYPDHQDILVEKVLKLLEKKQLLLAGRDHTGEYYEPVHDALLQHWKTARQWISDFGAENISLQRQLWQAVLDDHKQQTVHYNSEGLPDDTNSFSKLWDNNTKLLQVLDQVSEAAKPYCLTHKDSILNQALLFLQEREQDNFKNIWQDFTARGEVPRLGTLILSGYSDKLLALFLKKGTHWLNEAEIEFVEQSWRKRIRDILDIKEQRDEALALALNSRAQAFPRVEKATALRITQVAWEKTAHPLPEVMSTLARLFYSQLGSPLQPLLSVDFVGHTDVVYSAIFSPDGSKILTASGDDTARLWNVDGELLANFVGHKDWVKSAIFSPDGSSVLTISDDETLKLWDTTGVLLSDFVGHTDWVNSAVFSPDGSQVLSASKDHTAILWTLNGEMLAELEEHASMINTAIFSPDGRQILTASKDKTAKLWSITGELLLEIAGHTAELSLAIFSPDGSQILTASKDNTAKLWNIKGEELTEFLGHTNTINTAGFSPDGSKILTASKDNSVKLWSTTGKVLANLTEHISAVNSAVFSADGRQILTAADDETAKLWDTRGNLLAEFVGHAGPIKSAVFSPDNNQILTASDDHSCKCWHTAGERIVGLLGHRKAVISAVFSPDGSQILTGSNDHTAKLWNTRGRILTTFVGHSAKINTAVFSPAGNQILTTSDDNTVKLWDSEGKLLVDFVAHKNIVNSAVFSPDGSQILTAADDNTARLWNDKGRRIANLVGHTKWIKSAVFSPDGSQILTTSDDKTAKLWDTGGELLTELKGHTDALNSGVFSPDGSQILTAADDNTAKLWNINEECLADFIGHTDEVNAAVFSADGSCILTASNDKTAKLWNIKGECLADFVGHTKWVNTAIFSPDGSQVLTVSHEDNTAKLWNLKGEMLADFAGHTDMINSAVFSPDGSQVITTSADKTAKIWPTPQRIYDYLKKESAIAKLTTEQRRAYRIE